MSTSAVEARAIGVKSTISIRLTEKVTLENLHGIIDRVTGMSGCLHCGLLGIDLLLSGDPVESHQLKGLPGVQSVGFGE